MLTVDYRKLGVQPGDRLLDLGCGFGRHAYQAARLGAQVVAFDAGADEVRQVLDTFGAMVDAGELLRLVSLQEVGDQMQVDVRHDGQYKTMHVTLGALPARLAPSRPARQDDAVASPASQSRPASQPASKSAQTAPASRKAA